MVYLWWWLKPALGRARAGLGGSWLWGCSLIVAGFVPLTALSHASPWVCLASGAALMASGVAALASRGRRAGDVLLIGALAVILLWSFWHVGGVAQVCYAVLVLTGTGLGLRSLADRPHEPRAAR